MGSIRTQNIHSILKLCPLASLKEVIIIYLTEDLFTNQKISKILTKELTGRKGRKGGRKGEEGGWKGEER